MPGEYEQIAQAIAYLVENQNAQPGLDEIAQHAGLSPHHFQRLFTRWAGISPKRMMQYLTAIRAGDLLRRRVSNLDASLEAGLSSTSRLHELMTSIHGMSPAEYRDNAAELDITWGTYRSPFGDCLIATTDKGVCWLSFFNPETYASNFSQMSQEWRGANLHESASRIQALGQQIFTRPAPAESLGVLVKGTNFQVRVWEALLKIPPGSTATYGDISRLIGKPTASRAVGGAIGSNPVSWLIPCHRVIQSSGLIGGYRWGPSQKGMLLMHESIHASSPLQLSAV